MSKQTQITSLREIEVFLKRGELVSGIFPDMKRLLRLFRTKKKHNETVKIFYGETYDLYGLTVDSLKYYLFLGLLYKKLKEAGVRTEGYVNIADAATVINPGVKEKPKLKREGKKRLRLIKQISQIYDLNLRPFLMNQKIKEPEVIRILKQVRKLVKNSKRIMKKLEGTVLKNRLKQEYRSGFRYAAEEIALSLQFEVKVGPPRERHYDQVTAVVAKELAVDEVVGIYLRQSYPLGKNFSYFLSHPEIEKYGLTPYKASSNQLNDFRVVLGKTSRRQLKDLIYESFVSQKKSLPNPVKDLVIISELARELLGKEKGLIKGDLREVALKSYQEYIFKPLKGVVYE